MKPEGTLLLQRRDVAELLSIEECIDAVEEAFKIHAEGRAMSPKVLGMHAEHGGFHIKAGILELPKPYFVAKVNANFPGNKQHALPTIQGIIVVCDANNGRLLAVMDSIEITIIRTGAATAVAAKYLAPHNVRSITICGCGNQGRISLKALMKVRSFEKVYAYDIDEKQLTAFKTEFEKDVQVIPISANELTMALKHSQICVTCTPSKKPFVGIEDIMPGTFIAAVGADSEEKQELCPELIASSKIVVDLKEQSAMIGELHHVIDQNVLTLAAIHAELGMILAGMKPGRESNEEVIIFDSTGMALQDVAAASIVYEKALRNKIGTTLNFLEDADNLTSIKNSRRDVDTLKGWFPFH
jgi:alanine dehydrogenase